MYLTSHKSYLDEYTLTGNDNNKDSLSLSRIAGIGMNVARSSGDITSAKVELMTGNNYR